MVVKFICVFAIASMLQVLAPAIAGAWIDCIILRIKSCLLQLQLLLL